MKSAAAILCALCLTGCTTIRERGQIVFQTSSNLSGVHFRSAAGTTLDAESIDNSSIHRAVGAAVTQGAMGVGAALMTSGLTKAIH